MPAKIMLVTGGSRGIGAATARMAGLRGYDVAISYRHDAAAAEAVCADVIKAGRRALAVQADSADPSAVARLFDTVDARLGRLDVLFNNAGQFGLAARFVDIPLERIQRTFALNTVGAYVAAQHAVRRLSTRLGGQGGAIVNMSSMAARLGGAGEATDYAASKGAIDTLTIGLAKELAGEGIRVNAVRPGLIYTEIHAQTGAADRVDRLKSQVPMQRGGSADEVAEAVLWLASEQASYVTGVLVDVAGGRGL